MQKEIKEKIKMFDASGNIMNPGYAKRLVFDYHKDHVTTNKLLLKEWDYYLVHDDQVGLALTMDDNGYMGLMSVSIIDFKQPKEKTVSLMFAFPLGKLSMPANSYEDQVIEYQDKRCHFKFSKVSNKRYLSASMKNFVNHQSFSCTIEIDDLEDESMCILTPFEKSKRFYLNQKINCMPAKGFVEVGTQRYEFKKAFAVLDWGRGVWTYHNTWYWGSASGELDGKRFGFNIGYGFGDCSNASENMLFYDGKAHKLEDVVFEIPSLNGKDDFMSPWRFTSSDQRFEMDFTPIIDRAACTDVKLIKSDQHQVFGKFNGFVVLDDGTKLVVKDFLGFAEKVENKW